MVAFDRSFLSPASRAWDSLADVIPGLHSLRSLTRGYYYVAAPRLVDRQSQIDPMTTWFCFPCGGRDGSVSVKPDNSLGCGNLRESIL